MKTIKTGPGGRELPDLLKIKNVSHTTASRLETFMEQLDNRLLSKGIYYRVRTHDRGLTYFPTDKDRPKAFWINLAEDWFTIAYTDKDGEHSRRVLGHNMDTMLDFAENLF